MRMVSVTGFSDLGPGSAPTFSDRNLGCEYNRKLRSDPDPDPFVDQDLGR